MRNLDHLFTFPIIMVDGDNEERKEERNSLLAIDNSGDVDIIEGQADVPYYDFISVSDRWKPTEESLNKAINGKFDACAVLFAHSGTFIVPWTKKKFLSELREFIEKQPERGDIIIGL